MLWRAVAAAWCRAGVGLRWGGAGLGSRWAWVSLGLGLAGLGSRWAWVPLGLGPAGLGSRWARVPLGSGKRFRSSAEGCALSCARRHRRGRTWSPLAGPYHGRPASPALRYVLELPHAKTVILGTARTPIGKMGGGLAALDATDLGGTAIAAALERAEVAPEQVQHVVMGQVLQAGQGQIPSRQAQIKGGIPKEVSSETINKVCASGLRASVILDQAIRAGDVEVGVGGGMESMSGAPVPAPERALRLPHGRREGARRDGQRRPHQPLQRQADVRRGDRDRRRARAHAPRPRPLGAALPRARPEGDRRGPARRGDRARHGQVAEGGHGRRDRRGPAPRLDARGARQAPRARRQGGQPHRRQLAGRQRRRRRDRRWPPTSGPPRTARRRSPRSSPTPRARTTSPTSRRPRPARRRRRSPRPASPRRTSTSGRSTRRSPR